MTADSEPIRKKSSETSSLAPVAFEYANNIQFKLFFFIFIIFLFLSSDAFISRILSKFNGAVSSNNDVTSVGTIVTGLMLVFFGIIIDILIKNKYI
jgi:hypothetical protein